MTEFRILGSLELNAAGAVHPLRGPKIGKVLALLLVHANQVVDIDTLIEELWDAEPPVTAVSTVRTHVYHLRRRLEQVLGPHEAESMLLTRPPGYLLRLREDQLDADRFARLHREGQTLLGEGRAQDAMDRLDQALGLWRGQVLADVAKGRRLSGQAARLTELRTRCLELRIDAAMRLGRHRELVPDLRDLVAAHPLNEWFHARLIVALNKAGRRGEALRAFHDLRDVLGEELGLEPSDELRRLQRDILIGAEAVPVSAPAGPPRRAARP
ncbi:AfsR/SARP family transcriptional regulator [Thermomonospora echinospora]|nr:AfsR/SARP family transcriptional regulator [Thermomonospora echinospora]